MTETKVRRRLTDARSSVYLDGWGYEITKDHRERLRDKRQRESIHSLIE